jgi:hypothetical protein
MSQPCQTMPLKLKRCQLKATARSRYAAYAFYTGEALHCLMDVYLRLASITGTASDDESPIAQMIGLDAGGLKEACEGESQDLSLPIALNVVSHAFNLLVCAEHHASEYTKAMQGLLDLQGPTRSG